MTTAQAAGAAPDAGTGAAEPVPPHRPSAPAGRGPRGMTATLCRDPGQFSSLCEDWESLRRRSRRATAFQTHAWLDSWWRWYGRPGRLRVVLVRAEGGRLVGAAPLMLVHRPLPALVPIGGGISDYADVLLDDDRPDAADALAHALRAAARGAVVDLREVRQGAAAERLYAAWRGPRRRLPGSVCLELPGVPMESLLDRLPVGSARRTRRKLRKIDSLGVEERPVRPAEVPDAVRTMLRLHRLQWQGRGVTPEHLRPRFAAHLGCAVGLMVRDGDARVTEYRIDGSVMACDITLTSADLVCGYLYGAHPSLRADRIDITTMLLRHDARYAAETGRRTLSLLRGAEPHKLRWLPATAANQRLLLARGGLAPALWLHAAGAAARARAVAAVRERAGTAAELRARLTGGRGRGRGTARGTAENAGEGTAGSAAEGAAP